MSKWDSWISFIKEPVLPEDRDTTSDSGSIHFVYGDCTQPTKISPSEPTIVLSSVDNSGNWGHGAMFDALAKLSSRIPTAYEQASEFDDLHIGDLHLIDVTEDGNEQGEHCNTVQWVALAVVQSYNPRRKVPCSSISVSKLERCLSKVSFSAAQSSASIHMPQIGYQDVADCSEWYTVECLLRKYAAM